MSAAVLFCPPEHADSVARTDKGWTPAPDATRDRRAWLTAEGERVEHTYHLDNLRSRRAGLRIYLGFGAGSREVSEICAMARAGRFTVIEE